MEYDAATHTLSLNNLNLGCVYDDILRWDKMGCLVFYSKKPRSVSDDSFSDSSDFKIVLHGHNYIGGYSAFERRNIFWDRGSVNLKNNDNYLDSWNIESCFNCYKCDPRIIRVEGDGDLTLQGLTEHDVAWGNLRTDLPVWYSLADGINIKKHNGPVTPSNNVLYDEYIRRLEDTEFGDHIPNSPGQTVRKPALS